MYQFSKIFRVLLIFLAIPAIYCFHLPKTPPSACSGNDICWYGTFMKSYDESLIEAYLGVPYALPPLGELQFKDPKKWTPVHDNEKRINCKTDPPGCLQKDFRNRQLGLHYGVEDCLLLNVFRPAVSQSKSKPVLVEFVDIDFERGSSSTQIYGPEFVSALTNSIVVTVDSRLGIFGYLVHTFSDNTTIHGNMGLKDQQMALQWVYDNIKYFGGDPKKITVAGGASVSYHLVNEKSSKMIAKAIIRHANFITPYNRPWEYDSDFAAINFKKYAHLIDEIFPDKGDIIGVDGDLVLKKIPPKPTPYTGCWGYPYYRFRPVVDANNGADNPFLVDHPITLWSSNKFDFNNDIWFWQSSSPSFEWWIPMLWKDDIAYLEHCEEYVNEYGRRWWHIFESHFFSDYTNETNFNIQIHQYYFKDPLINSSIIYDLVLQRFIKGSFFPLDGLFSWGEFMFPMLKMIQLRPSGQYDRSYKRSFLTMYENKSKYRCFQTVYYHRHVCSDKPPLIKEGRWNVRGDELLFLYTMPWYFESPSERWKKLYIDMGKRYRDFLYYGFSNRKTVIKNCHIPYKPLASIDLTGCNYQTLEASGEIPAVYYNRFTGKDVEDQFNMWDVQIFEILNMQDKVVTPTSYL